MIEIDETEYKKLLSVSGAVQKMLANPKTRSKILEAQKEINPDAIIPELDATKPVFEKINAVAEQVSELSKKLSDKETSDKEAQDRAALASQWEKTSAKAIQAGYTAEGIEALEKYMVEKGVVDHEVAIAAFERMHPPEKLITHSADRFDAFVGLTPADEKDDVKMLLEGDDTRFLNRELQTLWLPFGAVNRR